jgi:hypothetical protein
MPHRWIEKGWSMKQAAEVIALYKKNGQYLGAKDGIG